MAVIAAIPLVFEIAKGVADLGVSLYSWYKQDDDALEESVDAVRRGVFRVEKGVARVGEGVTALEDSVDAVQRGVSRLEVGTARVGEDVGHLRRDLKAVRQEIQKVLDNQASLVALFSQGADEICARLDALHVQVNKGFNSVVQTVKDEAAIEVAREFKMRLGAVTMAYDLIMEDIMVAAKRTNKALPTCARRDVEKAEASANSLYLWASSFLPDNPGLMTKQARLQVMPYIVAMAYAVRVKVIAQFLERDMTIHEQDKDVFLNRARNIVDDFIAVLVEALEGLMPDTSLLEVALVYQLPMATYLTLMTSFRASVDELLSPSAEHKDVIVWDDGLSSIREALHWKASDADDKGQERTIEFKTAEESVWWAAFTDVRLDTVHISQLRTSIDICELCHVLGAGSDERIANIALKSGQKSALTKLPPASTLRTTLCAKIAEARETAQDARPPPPPQSFARTSTPPPPARKLRTVTASSVKRAAPARPPQTAGPRTLSGHSAAVYSVAVCPDGKRVISGSLDGSARVWSLSSGQHLCTFSEHTDQVLCVAASPDGRRAVSGSADKSVRVWSLDSGLAQYTLMGHADQVYGVAVSPDGRTIASGSADKSIKLWNMFTGRSYATLTGHFYAVYCVAFSPDGSRLVSGSNDKSIKVWNLRAQTLEHTLSGHYSAVFSVAVTPDGHRLLSGSGDRMAKVWSLSSGAEEATFLQHSNWVDCVAVFPDGQRFATSSNDKTIRVCNLRTRALERTLTGHTDYIQAISVSPDGRSLVSGSGDCTIKVWSLSGGGGCAADGRRC